MAETPVLSLENYRDLVSLGVPFRAPVSQDPCETQAARVLRAIAYLETEGTDEGLRDALGEHPRSDAEARAWLRALLTVRRPRPFPLDIQTAIDHLLQAECRSRPRIDPNTLPSQVSMPDGTGTRTRCAVWQGDITTLAADAIVNAANAAMLGCFRPFHACIDNAIHSVAGPRLRDDCARIIDIQGYSEPTGQAKATRAYHLPSRFVLHTVGPIVRERLHSEHERDLARCYRACLDTAAALDAVRNIAFCSISTGVFGFPRRPAARVALNAVKQWLCEHPDRFDLVVFDVFTAEDRAIYEGLIRSDGHFP